MPSETPYRRSNPVLAWGIPAVVALLLLNVLPYSGAALATGVAPPATLLGFFWQWLQANKESIAPLSQIASAMGVLLAAMTYLKSQKLSRANWLLQIQKDVAAMASEIAGSGGYTNQNLVKVINFFSSIFPHYHYRVISRRDWRVIEKDLAMFVAREPLRGWLAGASPPPAEFPRLSNYDPGFVDYLKTLQNSHE